MTIQIIIQIEEIKEPSKGKGGKKTKVKKYSDHIEDALREGEMLPEYVEEMEDTEWESAITPMQIEIKRTRNPFKMGRI